MTIERPKCMVFFFILKKDYFDEFYRIEEPKVQLILLFLCNFS